LIILAAETTSMLAFVLTALAYNENNSNMLVENVNDGDMYKNKLFTFV
jgi:hypothetical protein